MPNTIEKKLIHIDAAGQVLGRVATIVAKNLMGKHKALYTPHLDMGDRVVVINAAEVKVTGTKLKNKIYYRHTGYPHGLRSETLGSLMIRRPEEALRRAVEGMLPKNKLRSRRMVNLRIYAKQEHAE